MPESEELNCRVCGFAEATPPWGQDGKTPDFDYCVCCGVEHGYQDATILGARRYREKWISEGAKWDNPTLRPDTWDLESQLRQVPDDFR
jgi:hypothetical protein